MKNVVLINKQTMLDDAVIEVQYNHKNTTLSKGEQNALKYQYALKAIERKLETQAATRYSLIYDAYTQAVFSDAGFSTMEEWLDSFDMNPKADGNLGQVYRIATILTVFCEEQYIAVNGNTVNHDWFIDDVMGKCRVNRARHIISRAQQIIDMTSKTFDQRADEVTQLLRWVDDPNITNQDLIDYGKDGQGQDGEAGGDGFRIPATARYQDGVFVWEMELNADEHEYLKRKTYNIIELNEV